MSSLRGILFEPGGALFPVSVLVTHIWIFWRILEPDLAYVFSLMWRVLRPKLGNVRSDGAFVWPVMAPGFTLQFSSYW